VTQALSFSNLISYFIFPKRFLNDVEGLTDELATFIFCRLFLLKNFHIFAASFIFFYDRPTAMLMFFFSIIYGAPLGPFINLNLITDGDGMFSNFQYIAMVPILKKSIYILGVHAKWRVWKLGNIEVKWFFIYKYCSASYSIATDWSRSGRKLDRYFRAADRGICRGGGKV